MPETRAWVPRRRLPAPPPEEERGETPLWQKALSWPFEQANILSGIVGANITYPFRKPPGEWLEGSLGAEGYKEYEEWKESPQQPYYPLGTPSIDWMKGQVGLGEKPEGYEMAKIDMADVAEMAPWMFLGGGGAATKLPKAGQMLKATKPAMGVVPFKKGAPPKAFKLPEPPVAEIPKPPITKAPVTPEVTPTIPEVTQEADILTMLGRAFRISNENARFGREFIATNIDPVFNKKYGFSPSITMEIRPLYTDKYGKELLVINTAGWRGRAQEIGLEFLQKTPDGDLFRIPKAKVPKTAKALEPQAALADGESPVKLLAEAKPPKLPGGEPMIASPSAARTFPQLQEAHRIAQQKLLYNFKTKKTTAGYKRFAKALTGKTSMKTMTDDEATVFIEGLKRLPEARGGKPPRIPITKDLMTEEFAKEIGMFKEIGFLERFRPARLVFQKMGLRTQVYEKSEWEATKLALHKETTLKKLEELRRVVRRPERREAIMDALENPDAKIVLSHEEDLARIWLRDFFDKWATDLGIPLSKRRKNYVTHIFEEATKKELREKGGIDPQLARALDFIGMPKKINMPFLKERYGREIGLIKDPFAAAEAYEGYAAKQYYYEPLLQRLRIYDKYLPEHSRRYLRSFVDRMTGRPLAIDREVNQTLKELTEGLSRANIPGANALAQAVARGNAGGLLAYNYTSLLYPAWLGFRPTSAIRNLGQQALAIADGGITNYVGGLNLRFTTEGKRVLSKSLTLASRKRGFVPGVDEAFQSRFLGRLKDSSMWMFKKADKENVINSFMAGYAKAKQLGLPEEWAIKYGDEVAMNTQYMYTQLGGAQWAQSAIGRVLTPLTSWPTNFTELMVKWASGRESYVLKEYMAQTGTVLKLPQNFVARRKELLSYLSLVTAAYAVEKNTDVKATSYTGWSSITNLARMIGGDLPGLEIPGAMARITAGILTGNPTEVKRGATQLRPDQFIVIAKQLENVMLGKADWLSLFIYLNRPEAEPKRGKWKPTPREGMPTPKKSSGKKWTPTPR